MNFFPLETLIFQFFITIWTTFEKDWFCPQSCHQVSANFSSPSYEQTIKQRESQKLFNIEILRHIVTWSNTCWNPSLASCCTETSVQLFNCHTMYMFIISSNLYLTFSLCPSNVHICQQCWINDCIVYHLHAPLCPLEMRHNCNISFLSL